MSQSGQKQHNKIGGTMGQKVKKIVEILQNEKRILITYKDIASILDKDEDTIKKRAYRKGNFKDDELFKIANYYDVDYALFADEKEERETLVIDYYENDKLHLKKHPKHKKYYMDKDFASDYNPNYKASDFKILSAIDDTMDGGVLWIHEGDVVLLDVTIANADKPGMYVYECLGGKYMRAACIDRMMNGDYKFTYQNPKYEPQIRTPEELKEVGFKIVGRIIKNLMFFA